VTAQDPTAERCSEQRHDHGGQDARKTQVFDAEHAESDSEQR
jgi:hypothetical protein